MAKFEVGVRNFETKFTTFSTAVFSPLLLKISELS